jgi:hypothetical protein
VQKNVDVYALAGGKDRVWTTTVETQISDGTVVVEPGTVSTDNAIFSTIRTIASAQDRRRRLRVSWSEAKGFGYTGPILQKTSGGREDENEEVASGHRAAGGTDATAADRHREW